MSASAETVLIPVSHGESDARTGTVNASALEVGALEHATLRPGVLQSSAVQNKHGEYTVTLAVTQDEIEACQRLRHRVSAREPATHAHDDTHKLDADGFDPYCHHVMVKNKADAELLATTRILTDENAALSGRFHAETEFDLRELLTMRGRFMEIGRTCVHPEHHRGHTLAELWRGVARVAIFHHIDYLIGTASIPLSRGDAYVDSILQYLNTHYMHSPEHQARPRVPLPRRDFTSDGTPEAIVLPPLLKAFIRQGARVCAAPYWDARHNSANILLLLPLKFLTSSHAHGFIRKIPA